MKPIKAGIQLNKFSHMYEFSKSLSIVGMKFILLTNEVNSIKPTTKNMNKLILSLKKENLILKKDRIKENTKNSPDIAKAVGKRKTPKRKEYLPILR